MTTQHSQPEQAAPPKPGGLGIAALILGILAIVFSIIPFINVIGIIVGIVGLVLGIVGIFKSHRIMSIVGTILSLIGLIMAFAINSAAVSSVDKELNKQVDGGSNSSSSSGAPSPPANKGQSDNGNSHLAKAPFGGKWEGENMDIALSKPTSYHPSDSAFVQGNTGRAVVFNVSVTNKTKDDPLPAMLIDLDAQAGGKNAEAIEDSDNNVGSSMNEILPGKTLTWKVAFAVPKNAKDMDVQWNNASAGGNTIVFSGKLP